MLVCSNCKLIPFVSRYSRTAHFCYFVWCKRFLFPYWLSLERLVQDFLNSKKNDTEQVIFKLFSSRHFLFPSNNACLWRIGLVLLMTLGLKDHWTNLPSWFPSFEITAYAGTRVVLSWPIGMRGSNLQAYVWATKCAHLSLSLSHTHTHARFRFFLFNPFPTLDSNQAW